MATALWVRSDGSGHDAAVLSDNGSALHLEGMALYRKPCQANVTVSYELQSHHCGRVHARIDAEVDGHRQATVIERRSDGWWLDGRPMGLAHLRHLHLGFTPATRVVEIRRNGPAVQQRVGISAVFFDLEHTILTDMSQSYWRQDPLHYDYHAPLLNWSGPVQISEDGFLQAQPNHWQRVA
ncbi:putative glycolipid-binding domain-containing protein [Falsirhodobacter sp. alg1]|uniref:putative glycolipid-binding domain-containing protein n=1 Tax=Falsirhodobacter sp. alg1 TaxID=1472418 RepID=UPI0005EE272F|nr:putative glycolipid-binding domain-containing protein [Falsirhodobacter sp. alg1]